jgi:hypothetical protein
VSRLLATLRAHPVISAVFAVCTIAGAFAGPLLLPDGLSDVRRVLGGAVAGFGLALVVTATKILDGDAD